MLKHASLKQENVKLTTIYLEVGSQGTNTWYGGIHL